ALEDVAPKCIGTWFKHGPQPASGVCASKSAQGLADCRRMMCEVVDDRDARNLGSHFQSPLHAFEASDGGLNRFNRDALPSGERGGGGGIECVVLAGHRQPQACELLPTTQQLPARRCALLAKIHGVPVRIFEEAVALDLAEGSPAALCHVFARVERDETAAARDEIDHALECSLHGFEIGVDVGVVELDMREDCRVRKIMQELWPLVEEGGVILVALKDEWPCAVLHVEAGAEIFGDAADEERRLPAGSGGAVHAGGRLEDPRKHAGGGGFAVRSADDEALAALQKFVVD